MSMGMDFTTDIFIEGREIRDIDDLNEEIEDVRNDIQETKERILMYCASGVSGVNAKDIEGNPIEPIGALHMELRLLFRSYEEDLARLYDLLYLKNDWDDENKKFKSAEFC